MEEADYKFEIGDRVEMSDMTAQVRFAVGQRKTSIQKIVVDGKDSEFVIRLYAPENSCGFYLENALCKVG